MTYPPPCKAGDLEWDGECHDIDIQTLEIFKSLSKYNIIIGLGSPKLLPMLAQTVGVDSEMIVKNNGDNLEVRINAVTHSDAISLLNMIKPKDDDTEQMA